METLLLEVKHSKSVLLEQQFQEGLLNWIMVPEGNENSFVGGAVFSFIPKNVELTYGVMSGDKDQSDISKDRIYGTATVTDGKTIKAMMYYKVDYRIKHCIQLQCFLLDIKITDTSYWKYPFLVRIH